MLKLLLRQLLFDNKCSLCGSFLESDNYICFNCKVKLEKMSTLKERNGIYYLYQYTDIKRIIFDLKFKNRKRISKILEKHVRIAINEVIEKEKIDIILSVPVNKKRMLERGYNQVDEILKSAKIKYEEIERIKSTKQMYKIKEKDKREMNVKGAFLVNENYKNKRVLIVDDIITTGATTNELKKELSESSEVEKVSIFTLSIVKTYFK